MTIRNFFKSCAYATAAVAAIIMTYSFTGAQFAQGAESASAVLDDEEEEKEEEESEAEAFNAFRSETMKLARAGEIDKLREMVKDDLPENRANWLDYLITAVTLDKAGDADDVETLQKTLDSVLARIDKDDSVLSRFSEYCSLVGYTHEDLANETLKKGYEILKNSGDAERQAYAKSLEGKIRFAELKGNEMKMEGLFLDGTEIDWNEYRGKVVLVDFWATWCPPCRAEYPNVLKLYKRYHDAGFEVVGYSLDSDLDALKEYIEEEKTPWKTVARKLSMEAKDKEDGKEYLNITQYYGINAIPTMVLVDKEGKAINLEARGARLAAALAEIFPDVPELEEEDEE